MRGANVKVSFTLSSGEINRPREIFLAKAKERTRAQKSLIIPCHTDKRTLITICADVWRRNGDFL